MTTRKWLAECHAWLDDPTSVQYHDHEIWYVADTHNNPIDCQHLNWRIRPTTIAINGVELPKPVPEIAEQVGSHWLMLESSSCSRQYFHWHTSEDRDAVYAKLVEILS